MYKLIFGASMVTFVAMAAGWIYLTVNTVSLPRLTQPDVILQAWHCYPHEYPCK